MQTRLTQIMPSAELVSAARSVGSSAAALSVTFVAASVATPVQARTLIAANGVVGFWKAKLAQHCPWPAPRSLFLLIVMFPSGSCSVNVHCEPPPAPTVQVSGLLPSGSTE